MSAAAASLVRTFKVGRYTATLTAGPNEGGVFTCVCDWQPHKPNDLTPSEVQEYRRHLASAATELGRLARTTHRN